MIYTRENIKYLLFAEPNWLRQSYGIPQTTTPPLKWVHLPRIMHSGLTQWGKVFKGCYDIPRPDNLDNYNVVHINYTPSNVGKLEYLHNLIGDSNDIKIVVNIDHAIDLWGMNGFIEIHSCLDELQLANHIFSVEQTMADTLSVLLERKVYTIPHPTDTEMIRENFLIEDKEKNESGEIAIAVFFHSYDKNWLLVTNLLNQLKKERDVLALAIGATENFPAFFRRTFDIIYNRVDFATTMKVLAKCDIAIDTAVTHSYGRVPIEAACLGVPCITDRKVESGCVLFSNDDIDIFNIDKIKNGIDFHLDNNGNDLYNYEHYGYDRSSDRFITMLNDRS